MSNVDYRVLPLTRKFVCHTPLPGSVFLHREIEGKIEESKQQITNYREELLRARVIRKHRQEYDAMAKVSPIPISPFHL